jgi:hypothetical protein
MNITDSVELHGIPFSAQVGIDAKGQSPQNRIDKYLYPVSEGSAPKSSKAATSTAAAGGGAAPWAR